MNKFENRGSFSKGGGDRFKKKEDKDGLRVNREIRAPQIRVIDDEGQMLGVMTVPEAVRIAEEKGLDLLEIAPTATPPTCKIMDYGKWKYENKKKLVAARKKQTVIVIKEIQMRPRTDIHDFETKMKHARSFLLEGDKVKINMRFLGRELAHQEFGMELMKKAIAFVDDLALIETSPRFEGKQMYTLIAPDPAKIKEYEKKHPKKNVAPKGGDEGAERTEDSADSE